MGVSSCTLLFPVRRRFSFNLIRFVFVIPFADDFSADDFVLLDTFDGLFSCGRRNVCFFNRSQDVAALDDATEASVSSIEHVCSGKSEKELGASRVGSGVRHANAISKVQSFFR